jgi:hypothetical protein
MEKILVLVEILDEPQVSLVTFGQSFKLRKIIFAGIMKPRHIRMPYMITFRSVLEV